MSRTVAIVFDENYSSQLEKTAFHTPVWLIDTPENRAAAEEASGGRSSFSPRWERLPPARWPVGEGVTTIPVPVQTRLLPAGSRPARR